MLNGSKVRELRNSKGYTTLDISNFTHISKSYIEELERGTKRNPAFNKVVLLAEALGVKIDELVLRT
ncbi:helix-turn-helix domain-containing protein [Tissierella pigra]|uniref:Helix-turn-helix transcriptional regulator n=1 Tax=Tissierella pigra TaxID=2607614 RepID=A0A6N7XX91_9FIRM|nr:helix-turn-helix transcriptional regulator [Tissierella pigra]MBU5424876.1 helix-turn-helix domain-containing protein [Tissierella pigra]MSU01184.1 helix-turn-helix transcriptional regulator [Tissierella pigra]